MRKMPLSGTGGGTKIQLGRQLTGAGLVEGAANDGN